MMMVCAFLLGFLGAVLVYLSHPQQRLLRQPLATGTRMIGLVAIIASVWSWCTASGAAAGIAGVLTSLMLAWVAMPYLSWWRRQDTTTTRTAAR
jgi:uncharacterized membrane protein YtjA (UPF0391 family)